MTAFLTLGPKTLIASTAIIPSAATAITAGNAPKIYATDTTTITVPITARSIAEVKPASSETAREKAPRSPILVRIS